MRCHRCGEHEATVVITTVVEGGPQTDEEWCGACYDAAHPEAAAARRRKLEAMRRYAEIRRRGGGRPQPRDTINFPDVRVGLRNLEAQLPPAQFAEVAAFWVAELTGWEARTGGRLPGDLAAWVERRRASRPAG